MNIECVKCGYILDNDSYICPNCQYDNSTVVVEGVCDACINTDSITADITTRTPNFLDPKGSR